MTKLLASLTAFTLILIGCQREPSVVNNGGENILRIAADDDPQTLDPRKVRDLASATYMHMLFEGLMQVDAEGTIIPGIAEAVDISNDQKTYTFHLRESVWSNGDPLTAQDFVDTWKGVLDPTFTAPNAYQLFVIKGAKAAKEGKGTLEDVAVTAPSPMTLVVELEHPVPYFLDLTAAHFYFPVHSSWRKETGDHSASKWVSNGPFVVESWKHHNELVATKNSNYWDGSSVRLDKIVSITIDSPTSLQLFETGKLDWAGSPLSEIPAEALATLKRQHQLKIAPAAGTHWLRVNTEKPPLNNLKMRKAFSYAIDRKALVDHVLQGNQAAAMGIVPPSLRLQNAPYFEDHDIPKAWYMFQEGLKELGMTKEDLPAITLCYGNSERNHKIAQTLQQQWNKAFGVEVHLQNCEGAVFYDKISHHDYQLATGSWFADFRDPSNFLEIFKSKGNSTNNTQWENERYAELLTLAAKEFYPEDRAKLLRNAERQLMEEMPVIPLFYSVFLYVKRPEVQGVYFSDLGYLDFRHAWIGYEDTISMETPD